MGFAIGQNLEGQRQQRIARQHGGRFVEFHMGGGLAPAQHIVIHAGQIVMDERISVHGLQRRADPQRWAGGDVEQAGRRAHQKRPQPLAAGEDGIAHRFLHPGVTAMGLGQKLAQHAVHGRGCLGERRIQFAEIRPLAAGESGGGGPATFSGLQFCHDPPVICRRYLPAGRTAI